MLRFLSALAFTLYSLNSQAFFVLIDPGHGGSDRGAVRGELKESEIALKVAHQLADMLRADSRFKVAMTRDEDRKLTLKQRARIAKDEKPDLFLSIHLNSSKDPRAHGREFYFQNQLPADEETLFLANRENEEPDAEDNSTVVDGDQTNATDVKRILEDLRHNHRVASSSLLAKDLLEAWLNEGQSHRVGSRAIRQAPFYVVSNVPAPSVLVELGFLSHVTEGPRLAEVDYQKLLARSLYEGLVKYKETMDKDHASPLDSSACKTCGLTAETPVTSEK